MRPLLLRKLSAEGGFRIDATGGSVRGIWGINPPYETSERSELLILWSYPQKKLSFLFL
jgi:hypothetical protein